MASKLTESLLEVNPVLPDITAQHVLEAIGDIGIDRDSVIMLAYRLNLPQLFISEIEQEKLSNDNLAVRVIMRWQQFDDSSTSGKGHAKLGAALRRCGLKRIARRMRLRDRSMSSPGGDVMNYVLDKTEHFSQEQLEQFGIDLGLTAAQIHQTLTGTNTRSSGLLAVRMVSSCWQQDESAHEYTVRCKVNRALSNVEIPTIEQDHSTLSIDEPVTNNTTDQAKQSNRVTKISLLILSGLLAVFLVTFIIALAAIGVLETTPYLDDDIHVTIQPGDTVLVRVPHIYWIYSIDLHLNTGTGGALSVNCSDIVTSTMESQGLNIDGHYLVEGSVLTYNISQEKHGYTYKILMITSPDEASKVMDNEYECADTITYCCTLPPDQSVWSITIPYSSYYYQRCVHNDYNCSRLSPWHQTVVQYNYSATEPHAVSKINLTVVDSTLYLNGGTCVLARVDHTPLGNTASLHIHKLTRQWIYLIYPRVWVGISGVILVIIVILGGVTIANFFTKHYTCRHV